MAPASGIALLGDFSGERLDLRAVAADFGWAMHSVKGVSELRALAHRLRLDAVMIHAKTAGESWMDALALVRQIVPDAKLVLCHGIDELQAQPDMIMAGVFQALLLPLNESEVRRALGFVWAELRNRAREERPVPRKRLRIVARGAAGAA
jgi:DNA-binding NtrC family response regulator